MEQESLDVNEPKEPVDESKEDDPDEYYDNLDGGS
jgi:hypothetical protein